MRFVKMHGIGNDYIYLDAITDPAIESCDLCSLARTMSDRHTGVGADGLIVLCAAHDDADLRMRMFNADGSESEMCGNGIRCVAKFAHDRLGISSRPMRIATGRGVLAIDYDVQDGRLVRATVDMGEPELDLAHIGVNASAVAADGPEYDIDQWRASFVSMGNPHCVIFVDDPEAIDLARHGPRLENHPAFPNRANIHFVRALSPAEAAMRTWERGSGITMACGTGACAVLVAGALTGRLGREAVIHLTGGDLDVRWDEATGHVSMTGPATEVFEGEWPEYHGDQHDTGSTWPACTNMKEKRSSDMPASRRRAAKQSPAPTRR